MLPMVGQRHLKLEAFNIQCRQEVVVVVERFKFEGTEYTEPPAFLWVTFFGTSSSPYNSRVFVINLN